MKRAKKAVLRSFLATEPESGLTSARTVQVLCIAARAVQLGSVAAETKGTHPALGQGKKISPAHPYDARARRLPPLAVR